MHLKINAAREGNNFDYVIAKYVQLMIDPVWHLLTPAPDAASTSVQHFLDYLLAITDRNNKYLPVVCVFRTGALVLN